MAVTAVLQLQVSLLDEVGDQVGPRTLTQGFSAISAWQSREVTLTASTNNALTIPTGAKLLLIYPGTAKNLTLKGISGDTGIPLCATTLPLGIPAVIPLGTSAAVVIRNNEASDQTIRVVIL